MWGRTVLVDGEAVRSCVTSVGDVQGKDVTTIEGLEHDGQLHPLQQAFLTTGPSSAATALRASTSRPQPAKVCPHPSEADVVAGMDGNICRCGGYRRITRAIRQAASTM